MREDSTEGGERRGLSGVFEELDQLTVQQLRCYRIDVDGRRAVGVPADQLASEWRQSDGELWIDIQASDPKEFQALLEHLDSHPLIIEDCLEPQRSSRFSSYESSLHLEVPVLSAVGADNLSVICVPQLLITIHGSPIPEIDRLSQCS